MRKVKRKSVESKKGERAKDWKKKRTERNNKQGRTNSSFDSSTSSFGYQPYTIPAKFIRAPYTSRIPIPILVPQHSRVTWLYCTRERLIVPEFTLSVYWHVEVIISSLFLNLGFLAFSFHVETSTRVWWQDIVRECKEGRMWLNEENYMNCQTKKLLNPY